MPTSAGRARLPGYRGRRAWRRSSIIPTCSARLLTMQALTRIARAISYCCAHATDMARIAGDGDRTYWQERANLLTPVAKAFSTDVGVEVASLGVQVHGGMGFIEETGAASLYRDARIAPIYEGTNGIQAIDLVTRKLPQSDGEHVHAYIAELAEVVAGVRQSNLDGFGRTASELRERARRPFGRHAASADGWLRGGQTDEALAGATPYLRLFALGGGRRLSGARRAGRRLRAAHRALPLLRRKPGRRNRARCGTGSSKAPTACSAAGSGA